MSTHFHTLRIKKLIRETADCISMVFDVPENLQSAFEYKEGQNITIKKVIGGEEIRRSYSICNAPFEHELKVAVKKVEGGKFSSFANDELKENDTLEVMSPAGKFNARLSDTERPCYLAIAAGSGITPVISIIKHTLHLQPNSHFTLIYGSKTRHSIIFFEELEALKSKYMDRFNLINILSQEATDAEIFHGRINNAKLSAFQKVINYSNMQAAYLCGPENMIFNASELLQKAGLDKSKIHFELFASSGFQNTQQTGNAVIETDEGPKSQVSINVDGRTFSFELGYNNKSILDAALQNGADLPFACKGGVCCTCRAKLLEGKVSMDVNYALEPEELEQGFILTCQSHPTSEKVVIDFDVR
jgi:ring-1,2-phenylacetyl-CoA epoxidase subunit PaaE